jgi:hypothetical protein
MRDHQAAEAYHTEQVQLEGRLPGSFVKGFEWSKGRTARIIDEDIYAPECPGCCGYQRFRSGGIADIRGDGQNVALSQAADLIRSRIQRLPVAGGYDDMRAFAGQRKGAGFSQSFAGCQYQCCFAL